MPIVHFINCKSQTAGGMKNVLGYISKEEKTKYEDKKFVTGLNCSPQSCYDEFNATKNMYHKNGGRMYYHMVQSFPKDYEIKPELAHKIAVELAEKAFGKYECVVATHIDREHIHSHFVFNSVSYEDGKKYHSDKQSVENLMKLSDEICVKYGVHVLDDPADKLKKKSEYVSDREYRAGIKGESFKFELMNVITQVMKQAKTKKQFCWLMRQHGYGVRWEDNRKYITYTCPNGRKCRCSKLHDRKFEKEMMELEFKIRRAETDVQQGDYCGGRHTSSGNSSRLKLESLDRTEQADVAGAVGDTAKVIGAVNESRDGSIYENSPLRSESYHNDLSRAGKSNVRNSDFSSNENGEFSGAITLTGWETERAVFLNAERARKLQAQAQLKNVQVDNGIADNIDSIVGGVAALASIINEPNDEEDIDGHNDSKVLAEEEKRKESLGYHMG